MAMQRLPARYDSASLTCRTPSVVAAILTVMSLHAHRHSSDSPAGIGRAAEYVRMSTEHQQYSTENQRDAIRRYAEERGLVIVRTFADAGKSGLGIHGRGGLQ